MKQLITGRGDIMEAPLWLQTIASFLISVIFFPGIPTLLVIILYYATGVSKEDDDVN